MRFPFSFTVQRSRAWLTNRIPNAVARDLCWDAPHPRRCFQMGVSQDTNGNRPNNANRSLLVSYTARGTYSLSLARWPALVGMLLQGGLRLAASYEPGASAGAPCGLRLVYGRGFKRYYLVSFVPPPFLPLAGRGRRRRR